MTSALGQKRDSSGHLHEGAKASSFYIRRPQNSSACSGQTQKGRSRQRALCLRLEAYWLFGLFGSSSGRLFNVGRSGSSEGALLPPAVGCCPPCPGCGRSVRVRNVGLSLLVLSSRSLLRFSMPRRRAFTVSNSAVVTMYCSRAGKTLPISFCMDTTRSGVGGWVEKNFGTVPGCRFSSASTFSKNVTKAFGS